MKYMTFNNSCFFAAIANILEKGRINVEDKDIVKNSLIPYIFRKDEITNEYSAGYSIQDDDVISEYLNRFGLRFISKKFKSDSLITSKKALIEDIKDKKYVIVSLKVQENNSWHATIFVRYRKPHFIFKNMKRVDSKESDYYMFTYEELLTKLADVVQYGFIANAKSEMILDKSIILGNSLFVLNQYKTDLIRFCKELHSLKDRKASRDILFRALFLNYLDLTRLLKFNDIESKLTILQKQYLDSFKNVYDIKISNYLDMDLLEEVFNNIIDSLLEKLENL